MNLMNDVYFDKSLPFVPDRSYAPYSKGQINVLGFDKASAFFKQKYEKDANKYWNRFYRNNKDRFFKDRHWIVSEFPELNQLKFNNHSSPSSLSLSSLSLSNSPSSQEKITTLMEAGCGVGNTIFPLLDDIPNLHAIGFDFSSHAVELVKKRGLEEKYANRVTGFVCDLTEDIPNENVADQSVDITTLVFVLSAISPSMFSKCVENVWKKMKKGGICFVRDYSIKDHILLKFKEEREKHKKLDDNFFVRGDGTRAYFFSVNELIQIFTSPPSTASTSLLISSPMFEVLECNYVQRSVLNVKENVDVERIFIQARFKCL